jgi:hypothetical protein
VHHVLQEVNADDTSFSIEDPVFLMRVVAVGGVFSAIVEYSKSPLAPPEGWQLAPLICVAFVMSVIWIMNIANEVLAVLETLGELWHLQLRSGRVGKLLYCCWNLDNYIKTVKTDLDTSLLVLEWSNSIGDLVSNMAMASRRCDDGLRWVLCGPMFNLLVGIGRHHFSRPALHGRAVSAGLLELRVLPAPPSATERWDHGTHRLPFSPYELY